jgi:hypothetical protein
MINNMHCREFDADRVMWPALVRLLLQQQNALEAFELLKKNIPCSGHNYMLCDADESFNVETTGKQWDLTGHTMGTQGTLLHTNHYLGRLDAFEIIERQSPTTHRRMEALEKYFEANAGKQLSREQLVRDLFESGPAAEAVCVGNTSADPHAGMTCGGLMVDHKKRWVRAFGGLYSEKDFVDWNY